MLYDACTQPQEQSQRCSAKCSIKWTLWTFLLVSRLLLIAGGMALQLTTCFRRDLTASTDLELIPNSTNTKQLSCDKEPKVICALIISDCVVFSVACWVYFVSKFCHRCFKWLEWKELSIVTKANTAPVLNELVEAVKSKLSMGLLVQYSIFALAYIILSQVVSVGYLVVFRLWDGDVVIQIPYGQDDLDINPKRWLLCLTFIGFVALDLLYVTVIMGYVYLCQLVIYYLEIIKHRAKCKHEVKCQDIYHSQKEAMTEVLKANKYIKYLNASSRAVGFIILFQVINCTFDLLRDEITYPEAGVITARLLLLASLTIYPLYKAASLNVTATKLYYTGLDMRIPYLRFSADPPHQTDTPRQTDKSHEGIHITLRKATMFGIPVNSWQPYCVILIMLLIIIVGSKLTWYEMKL